MCVLYIKVCSPSSEILETQEFTAEPRMGLPIFWMRWIFSLTGVTQGDIMSVVYMEDWW